MKNIKVSKLIFYFLLIVLPINLGKHFVLNASYVGGLLIDYLIPTLYVQDIVIGTLLLVWVVEILISLIKKNIKPFTITTFFNRPRNIFVALFLFSVFLSTLTAQRFVPSVYFFIRTLLYVGLFIYVTYEVNIEEEFTKFINIFSVSLLLLSLLGISQYIKQGSIFNNYLFFGEQPYTVSIWGVNREDIFNSTKVPSYGLFAHPNVFGGFLCICLTWLLFYVLKSKHKSKFLIAVFSLGVLALILSFSISAWLVLLLGILFIFMPKTKVAITALLSVGLLFLPLFNGISILSNNPSFYRRSNLLVASYRIIKEYPLFGVGANNITTIIEQYTPPHRDIRFDQPVHNIFVLIFAESGVFAFIFFLSLLVFSIKQGVSSKVVYRNLLCISLLQLVLLGSSDHYVVTIHQTQELFWIVLGLI